ncbi:GldG family protein [Candidatus Roizmanbacteria bacterium]|nr:GldG family protein [Candidatus Roizmanbacteria bacterium]
MVKKLRLENINLYRNLGWQKLQLRLLIISGMILFIAVNLVTSLLSVRFDLSEGKAYTLSPSSQKIIKRLDDTVNVQLFASANLPSRFLPVKADVLDLLKEYDKEGKGKVMVKIADPGKDEKALEAVKNAGVPELRFSQIEQNKYALTASYFGILITYGGKKAVLPQVTDSASLEYNLTAAIYRLTKKQLDKVGILGYESGSVQGDPMTILRKILDQQFSLSTIDISSGSPPQIDQSYQTILVFDNLQKQYTPEEVSVIRAYLDKKGKAIFFVDGVWVNDSLTAANAGHNLFPLLADYGITVNNNLILSTASEAVNFGSDQMAFVVPYPYWLKTANFDQSRSYFINSRQITYPWTSSLSTRARNGFSARELVKTTKNSWEQKKDFTLNPQLIAQPDQKDLRAFTVTAEASDKSGTRLIVIPSSRFVLDRFLNQSSDNLETVVNMVNDLASQGALSGIRSRQVYFYPLPDLPENLKDPFRYLNILLLPLIFGAFGAYRLMKRK